MMGQQCVWAGSSASMQDYHDHEWGFITHDERKLFELLSLEIMQAGLSWQTVLNKRQSLETAFANFEVEQIANFSERDFRHLMANTGIIRNRLKIAAIIQNARVVTQWHQNSQTLNDYLWAFTDNQQQIGNYRTDSAVPSESPLSLEISHDLKRQGFKFVGPKTVYSWLQASGVLNDHLVSCDCFERAQRITN